MIILFMLLAIGGRKDEVPAPTLPTPTPQEVATPAAATPAAPADPAPALFPHGLPVEIGELPPGISSLSAQSCNACHYSVHDQWRGSDHQRGWSREPYRSAAQAGGPQCSACHQPLIQQQSSLLKEVVDGKPVTTANPSWSGTLAQEGVTCAACHVREGKVVGTRAVAAPHPVVASDELAGAQVCAGCHQLSWPGAAAPLYDTYGEWSRSRWAEAGVQCQDCHMAAEGHALPGDPRRALTVLVDVAPTATRGQPLRFHVRLQNSGAGHAVPTGSPFKGLAVEMVLLDEAGKPIGRPWTTTLAQKVGPAPDYAPVSDTRLPAGGEREYDASIDLPHTSGGGRGTLLVRLVVLDAAGAPQEPLELQRIPVTVL